MTFFLLAITDSRSEFPVMYWKERKGEDE